jgi:2-methylisocitrate lyase-like PEP mutase family enzyme
VATTSAAIAPVLGYADHEGTPPEAMFAAVARIVRAVNVPVSADLEHGYGIPPEELVARIAETGAVGCNLEYTDPSTGQLVDVEQHTDYLAAIREAAAYLVVNARTDAAVSADASRDLIDEVINRCRRYHQAGADCVFPIFADHTVIREIVQAVGAPVAVLSRPGWPSLADLASRGVARISFGPGLYRASQALLDRMLTRIRAGADPYDS